MATPRKIRRVEKFNVKEFMSEYADKSALEVAQELQKNMTRYIGPGGRGNRTMRGRNVALAELLYNKLVQEGKISGLLITVTGRYRKSTTGKAMYELRKMVGGLYSPEQRRRLRNKNIEYTLDGYSLESIVKRLETPAELREQYERVSKKVGLLTTKLDFLNQLYDEWFGSKRKPKKGPIPRIVKGVSRMEGKVSGYPIGKLVSQVRLARAFMDARKYPQATSVLGRLEDRLGEVDRFISALDITITLENARRKFPTRSFKRYLDTADRSGISGVPNLRKVAEILKEGIRVTNDPKVKKIMSINLALINAHLESRLARATR